MTGAFSPPCGDVRKQRSIRGKVNKQGCQEIPWTGDEPPVRGRGAGIGRSIHSGKDLRRRGGKDAGKNITDEIIDPEVGAEETRDKAATSPDDERMMQMNRRSAGQTINSRRTIIPEAITIEEEEVGKDSVSTKSNAATIIDTMMVRTTSWMDDECNGK